MVLAFLRIASADSPGCMGEKGGVGKLCAMSVCLVAILEIAIRLAMLSLPVNGNSSCSSKN